MINENKTLVFSYPYQDNNTDGKTGLFKAKHCGSD